VARAVAALRAGNLVVLPTETVYGLAADPRFLGRLFAAKARDSGKPIAYLAPEISWFEELGADFTSAHARALAAAFWPGPLTLAVPGRGGWMGCRIPNHPAMLAVLRSFGGVLAVTSANRSGGAAARTAAEALAELGSEVAVALDAGPSPGGVPSTVVRVDGMKLEIIREGAISAARLYEAVDPSPTTPPPLPAE